ncbi:uncharacterized protein LOC134783885 [Penaeus indicus]|uniref:uncharacterized protein LOC134783885 n=1 Tax=Penaeus indicus TaxID=29960 RepID=UPI00300CA297
MKKTCVQARARTGFLATKPPRSAQSEAHSHQHDQAKVQKNQEDELLVCAGTNDGVATEGKPFGNAASSESDSPFAHQPAQSPPTSPPTNPPNPRPLAHPIPAHQPTQSSPTSLPTSPPKSTPTTPPTTLPKSPPTNPPKSTPTIPEIPAHQPTQIHTHHPAPSTRPPAHPHPQKHNPLTPANSDEAIDQDEPLNHSSVSQRPETGGPVIRALRTSASSQRVVPLVKVACHGIAN